MTEDQNNAKQAAEHDWESFGGPLIDAVEDGRMSAEQCAEKFTDAYGQNKPFWKTYITGVLRDRGVDLSCVDLGASQGHAAVQTDQELEIAFSIT